MRLSNFGIMLGEIDNVQGSLIDFVLNLFFGIQYIIVLVLVINFFIYYYLGINLIIVFFILIFVLDNMGQNFMNVDVFILFLQYDDGCFELEGVGDWLCEKEC